MHIKVIFQAIFHVYKKKVDKNNTFFPTETRHALNFRKLIQGFSSPL